MRTKSQVGLKPDLQAAIIQALDGSNSQKPVDTQNLYPLGPQERVEAALLELYHAHQVACCKITTRSPKPSPQPSPRGRGGEREDPFVTERIVWWKVGACLAHVEYRKPGRKAA